MTLGNGGPFPNFVELGLNSMRNIRLWIEYDGSHYAGWQRQNNAIAVQQVVEEALAKITGQTTSVIGSGRTDAGVHALNQVANFKTTAEIPCWKLQRALNAHLPGDVVIKRVDEVPEEFNARYSALGRTYFYYVVAEPTAIYRRYCWQALFPFDAQKLFRLAPKLVGKLDFASFCKADYSAADTICVVKQSEWKEDGNKLVYRITANRFLYGMVRGIVGTMMDVARGRFDEEDFEEILAAKNRARGGTAAPPNGLFLANVEYPE